MVTTDLLRARVEAGAATLDVTEGVSPSWRADISLVRLNLGEVRSCVLGQLFGDYISGSAALGFDPWGDTAPDLGFMPDDEDDSMGSELTETWRAYLQEETT